MLRKFVNCLGPVGFVALYGLTLIFFSMPFIHGADYLWRLDGVIAFVLFAALLFLLPGLGLLVISVVSYYGLRYGYHWNKYESAVVFIPFVLPILIGVPMAVISRFLDRDGAKRF